MSGFYLFLIMAYFFKIPLTASLNILWSDPHNLLKEVSKKIRKVHKKIFCSPSNILKYISWPINVCIKYIAPAKTLRPPSYILNVWSLRQCISGCILTPNFHLIKW